MAKILELSPDVVVIERACSRHAQELLMTAGITLLINVKHAVMQRLSRCCGAPLLTSTEQVCKLGLLGLFLNQR